MARKEAPDRIESLKNEVRALSQEIESIKTAICPDSFSPEHLLKTRGLEVFRKNPSERLFFPSTLSSIQRTRFYKLMERYSFRLTVRDMIKNQDRFGVDDLVRYCSPHAVQAYCSQLCEMGVLVAIRKGVYRTTVSPLYSFGPTLEWFVAEMFERAFASSAIYGVRLRRAPSGGDYDVLASWNRRLVYVEVKSSPPKGIEAREISTFFSRIDDLVPEVSLLFNDTQLRMKDKLVLLFEEEIEKRCGKDARRLYPVERLKDELFHVRNRIFILNSRKNVAENFRICLIHYLRHAELGMPPLSSEEHGRSVFDEAEEGRRLREGSGCKGKGKDH